MLITVPLGDIDKIEAVRVFARAGNEAWVIIKEVTMEHLLNLPNEEINPEFGYNELYNPVDNEYYFIFSNDGAYPIADQIEVDNLYDAIPQRAESLESINGNWIVVGGITEGYDKPDLEAEAKVTYYYPDINNETNGREDTFHIRLIPSGYVNRDYYGLFGEPVAGDKIVFKWRVRWD